MIEASKFLNVIVARALSSADLPTLSIVTPAFSATARSFARSAAGAAYRLPVVGNNT